LKFKIVYCIIVKEISNEKGKKVIYNRSECATFRKVDEEFGKLSNMAGGMPIIISNVRILTSEALYQSLRFTSGSDDQNKMQKEIIEQKSPMAAKMISKKYRGCNTRSDWDDLRVSFMKWVIRVKLAYNIRSFGSVLLATESKMIVEDSRRDSFWGAIPTPDNTALIGENVLGQLLVELREEMRSKTVSELKYVPTLDVPNFTLFGQPIDCINLTSNTVRVI